MGHVVRTAFAALAALVVPCATLAQDYPKKPMLVILPMQSASASDVMVRLVAQRMAENMKQQTVIVNMPGAAGLIGTERIARAAADGYTIGGLNDGLLTQIPYLYQKVPYDPVRSFDPVSMVAAVTYVLIVHPSGTGEVAERADRARQIAAGQDRLRIRRRGQRAALRDGALQSCKRCVVRPRPVSRRDCGGTRRYRRACSRHVLKHCRATARDQGGPPSRARRAEREALTPSAGYADVPGSRRAELRLLHLHGALRSGRHTEADRAAPE